MIDKFDFGKLNLNDPDFTLGDLAWCIKISLGDHYLLDMIRECLDYLDHDQLQPSL